MTPEERKTRAANMLAYLRTHYPQEIEQLEKVELVRMPDGTEVETMNLSAVRRLCELILDGNFDDTEQLTCNLEGHA